MSRQPVIVLQVGQPGWPRFMVHHLDRDCYWSKGRWRRSRRDGELWHDEAEADEEARAARTFDNIAFEE